MTTVLAILTALKPILAPLLTFLMGWLFPSPLQKVIGGQEKNHEAERTASDSNGNVSDLDSLP